MDIEAEKERLRNKAIICGVPDGLIEGLLRFIVEPGSCLQAILENDLMESFDRADEYTAAGMKNICTFLYSYAPGACHGSKERAATWVEHRRAVLAAHATPAPEV